MNKDYDYRNLVKKAEIKRVAEKLTKKELCTIYDINYSFYMNCVSARNIPSVKMVKSLEEYLETESTDIYLKLIANRPTEESYHEKLFISVDEEKSYLNQLREYGILKEPKL